MLPTSVCQQMAPLIIDNLSALRAKFGNIGVRLILLPQYPITFVLGMHYWRLSLLFLPLYWLDCLAFDFGCGLITTFASI